MITFFKTFFKPGVIIYFYDQSKESIIAKIEEVLKKKVSFLSSNDISGNFESSDTFSIYSRSPAFTRGIRYGSKLFAKIIESENGTAKIITKAKPSFTLYLMFFLIPVIGLIYLYKYFTSNSTEFLFPSLLFILLGPIITIGISNIGIASIRERYRMYIDKELKPKIK